MAKRIGDAGMVLPDAPKLMFENALALDDSISVQMGQLLRTSLGIEDDVETLPSAGFSSEQHQLLEEWQSVTTKARLMPKINFHELVDSHYPIPFLANIKAVRDQLSPKPEEPIPAVIEHYPQLLEVVAEWEQSRLEAVGTLVKAFADENGDMSEARYRDMHLALAVALRAHNAYSDMSLREALEDILDDESYKLGLRAEPRQKLFKDLALEDVQIADRCLKAFTDKDNAASLREAFDHHRSIIGNGSYPSGLFNRMMRQKRKLGEVMDVAVISRFCTSDFEEVLLHGKINSKRTKYMHRGVIRPLGDALVHNPDAELPAIDREDLASGALGVKMTRDAPKTAAEATQVEIPEGTPVDEDGNPLNQPRRPERLDLSAQVAEMESDDREDSDEATFEDFRFLIDEYGFRGLQIGNYVPQKMRRYLTGAIHQAVEDMASVAKMPAQLVALGNPLPDEVQEGGADVVGHQDYDGRSLGLALGARGRGKAAAHYEPAKHIINMTRDKGAGSLAHEWGHALDYTLSEMCDLSMANRRFADGDIARVTGRSKGSGVGTVTEAFAVYWTIATNQHVERQHQPPKYDEVRDFAAGLLKPSYATPEAIEMMTGMAYAMKAIYAEDVPDEQLSRDHGAELAEKISLSVRSLDRLLIQLSHLHYGTLNDDDARAKLMSEELWPFDGGKATQSFYELANLDYSRLEEWAVSSIKDSASEMLSVNRVPHDETLRKIAAPVRHAIGAVRDGSRLLVRAMNHDRLWSTDEADAYLKEHREHLEEEGKNVRAEASWRSLQLGEYLRHPPENERRPVQDLLDLINMQNDLLRSALADMGDELVAPTPHDMETTMSVRPAAIQLGETITAPNGNSLSLLATIHTSAQWAEENHGLAKGALALHRARFATNPEIRESRLEVHPRFLNRVQRNLAARFDHYLEHAFLLERQIIEAMEIEDPEDERQHPAVPSARARAAIHDPQVLKEVSKRVLDFDGQFRATNVVDLAGHLGMSAALSEKLAPCLAETTKCMRFSRLVDTLVDMKSWISSARKRQNETNDEFQARHAEADKLMEPLAVLSEEFAGQATTSERLQWLRSALNQGWRDALHTAGEQSGRLHLVGNETLRRDSEVGDVLDKLVYRCVTRPLTLDEDPKDPRCSQDSYQGMLRDLAGLADDYGARFAYMTPGERNDLLNEGLAMDIDWSHEAMKEAFMRGAEPVMNHNSLFHQRFHPPVSDWADIALKALNSTLHRKDMSRDERETMAVLRGDYRRDAYRTIPVMQTSRMARASAAYEKRDLGRNGYLRGSAPKYWSTPVELFARAFETYTFDALEAEGRESPYLVTVASRDRQERTGQQAEAVVAKQRLLQLGAGLGDHENHLYRAAPTDYSWTYPAGHMRNALLDTFKPLANSLSAGLAQRFPEAVALHELQKSRQAEKQPAAPVQVSEDPEIAVAANIPAESAPLAEQDPNEADTQEEADASAETLSEPQVADVGPASEAEAGEPEHAPADHHGVLGMDTRQEAGPLQQEGDTPAEDAAPEVPPALEGLAADQGEAQHGQDTGQESTPAERESRSPEGEPAERDEPQKPSGAKKPQQVSLGF